MSWGSSPAKEPAPAEPNLVSNFTYECYVPGAVIVISRHFEVMINLNILLSNDKLELAML